MNNIPKDGTYLIIGDMSVRVFEAFKGIEAFEDLEFAHQTFEFSLDCVNGQISVEIQNGVVSKLMGICTIGDGCNPELERWEWENEEPLIYLYYSFYSGLSQQAQKKKWYQLALRRLTPSDKFL